MDRKDIIIMSPEELWDFGPTFASEKLYELDGITISHETLRLWLI